MIRREDVADLQPGDVVELRSSEWHPEAVLRSPVRHDLGCVQVGPFTLSWPDGTVASELFRCATLTVVSRAPRPLYVNHPRTSPVPGDVVRDEDSGDPMRVWLTSSNEDGDTWWVDYNAEWVDKSDLPDRLRLLVDGETGQVVP